MFDRVTQLAGYRLHGIDGEIGSVTEFYFDDLHWTIRYLVADTGGWLAGREVLLSPYSLGAVHRDAQTIAVDLTKAQISDSPSFNTDRPVSRQSEAAYYGYYGWPLYWAGPFMWGLQPAPVRLPEPSPGAAASAPAADSHLRSTADVTGYHVHATDGEIGHVADFVIDDKTWAIRYLLIDTQNWWPGKKVLISPHWIKQVSWSDSAVYVTLDRDAIRQSPEFTGDAALTREYEALLHGHYGSSGYWNDAPDAAVHSPEAPEVTTAIPQF